jgi:L-alanine-DL-glutamate epimerase-like enolase superfamily enzyme
MKITGGDILVTSPGRNFVTLRLHTTEGIHGVGDATLNGRELAVASYLEDHVVPCLIGRSADHIEDIWPYLYRGAYWRRGPATMSAIAAVDTALWDIKGKALGRPVYDRLGGPSAGRASLCTGTQAGRTPPRPWTRWDAISISDTAQFEPSLASKECRRPTVSAEETCSTNQPNGGYRQNRASPPTVHAASTPTVR